MPWCPNCKDEYKEGITVCADCGCELVDDLSLIEEVSDEESENLTLEMEENELSEAYEELEELEEQEELEEEIRAEVYVNNEEKAEENKSSAYTLLIIGSIGLAGVIMFMLDVFETNMSKSSKYMISGVMGTLFVLFLVMGFVSLKNFKVFKSKAHKENNLTNEITKWAIMNSDREVIDSTLNLDNMPEEAKYFERTKFLKNSIRSQFMNLDESYLNRLVDEIYQSIFEK